MPASTPSQFKTAAPFSDAEWITVPNVPLIDAHILQNSGGRPQVSIDARFLEEVANNNNLRYATTGDATPGVLGHTTDNPADPEKPVKCWFTNFKVRPGPEGRPTLFADQHVKRRLAHILEDFPRRSVELWIGKKEIDPVALLGGSTPERNLGVTRYAADEREIIRFSRTRQDHALFSRPLEAAMPRNNGMQSPAGYPPVGAVYTRQVRYQNPGAPARFAEGLPDDNGGDNGGDNGDDDPMIAKILGSAAFKSAIRDMIDEALGEGGEEEGMEGEGEMPPPGADAGMPPGGPGGPPGMPPGMPPGGPMGAPPGVAPEGARFQNPPPVRFEEDNPMAGDPRMFSETAGAYPSGSNTFIPGGGTNRRRMTSQGSPMRAPYYYAAPDEYDAEYYEAEDTQARARLSRVERENQQLRYRLARADAQTYVRQLIDEGVVIEDPSYLAEQLANFEFVPNGIKARNEFIEKVIKRNFARREHDPAAPVDVMRYSRIPADTQTASRGPTNNDETQKLVRFAREHGISDMAQAWAQMNGAAPRK